MIILLHSSKTMKRLGMEGKPYRAPALLDRAVRLDAYLKTLPAPTLARVMSLSADLAAKTGDLIAAWTPAPADQSLALDSFAGDIYSGLHANDLSPADRDYADRVLFILSGLYGVIRPYDGISPYRLEMGYRLPDPAFSNLYAFWSRAVADCLPREGPVVNLSATEYSQVVAPYVDNSRVASPRFLTVNPKTGQPAFVVVHAKIARGAFARWLITQRVENLSALPEFADLGYRYDPALSTPASPVFVCQEFGGKGLSIRLA